MTPKRIVALRKRLHLTQRQLAEKIGAQQHTVARWEIGQNQPRGANLKALVELEKAAKLDVMAIRSVPVGDATREAFKKNNRELGRCLVCKEPWGKRSATDLMKRHEKCFEEWETKYTKRPG